MKSIKDILDLKEVYQKERIADDLWGGLVKLPDAGIATVLWSRESKGYEHVSVSPISQYKMPSWNDMCFVKDLFWSGEEEAFQLHPKKSEHVNIKRNCLHLWKVIGHEIEELVEK